MMVITTASIFFIYLVQNIISDNLQMWAKIMTEKTLQLKVAKEE